MMNPLRATLTVLGFAAVTATSGLALLTPHVTHADGEDRKGAYTSVEIYPSASFEKDDTAKNGWKIVLTASNQSDREVTEDVDVSVLFAVSNPNSRVGTPGQAVWRHKEKMTLAAHGDITKTLECPASIAKQLNAIEKLQAKREALLQQWQDKGSEVPQWVYSTYNAPRANYWVEAVGKPEPEPKPQGKGLATAKAKT